MLGRCCYCSQESADWSCVLEYDMAGTSSCAERVNRAPYSSFLCLFHTLSIPGRPSSSRTGLSLPHVVI